MNTWRRSRSRFAALEPRLPGETLANPDHECDIASGVAEILGAAPIARA